MSLIQMICLMGIIAIIVMYLIDRFISITTKSHQTIIEMNHNEKINIFNNEVRELIKHTYSEFPDGCPFKECQKDCILYQPTTRTTHSTFCNFLVDIGQRTILNPDSTEPQKIFR